MNKRLWYLGAATVALWLLMTSGLLKMDMPRSPVVWTGNVTITTLPPLATFSTNSSSKQDNSDVLEDALKKISNVPFDFWKANSGKKLQKNDSCAQFPNILEMSFNNLYWQSTTTSNGTLYLYGAYYDDRPLNKLGPTVRIIAMMDRISPTVSTTCQLWFHGDKTPVFAKVFEYKYMWSHRWGNYKQGILQPYLLGCRLPDSRVPAAVSVTEQPCDKATNSLRVVNDRPAEKKGFAVCVKGLDFLHADHTTRLVEWVELLGILGADKVFLYELQTHPNITRLLRYYQASGQVDVRPLTLPGRQPNAPLLQHLYLTKKVVHKRQNEVIPYNDCLYRNLYKYEFVVLLDIDEVIVPVSTTSWEELMTSVKASMPPKKQPDSYNVRNVYFLDDANHAHDWFTDIPHHMHMLQHVYRAKNFTKPGQYIKCFHNTSRVLALHNHFPFHCLGNCYSYSVPTDKAQLQHYRKDCVSGLKKSCEDYRSNTVVDTTIWKYKDELISRASAVLQAIGYTT